MHSIMSPPLPAWPTCLTAVATALQLQGTNFSVLCQIRMDSFVVPGVNELARNFHKTLF